MFELVQEIPGDPFSWKLSFTGKCGVTSLIGIGTKRSCLFMKEKHKMLEINDLD